MKWNPIDFSHRTTISVKEAERLLEDPELLASMGWPIEELRKRAELNKLMQKSIGLKHAAEHAQGKLDKLGKLVDPE